MWGPTDRIVRNLSPAMVAVALVAVVTTSAAHAGGEGRWEFSGDASVELRWYLENPQYPFQFNGLQTSLSLEPEIYRESVDRRHRFAATAFLRLDGRDDERSHVDLREATYRYVASRWELLAGVGRVFWGVTESRHLVDVINQDDLVEDIDGEDKLGQPMINLAVQRNWGRIEAFALVGFRQPTLPGADGRLRAPLPVATSAAVWESDKADRRVDLALRYGHVLGDWDFGVYVFEGTGREPRLEPDAANGHLIPHYDVIRQAGTDVQYTKGAWLGKLETIVREGQGRSFAATVAGVEYTFFQAFGAADVGVLAEYLYDGRDASAPVTAFDDDIFVGSRLALNDTQDTALLLGAVIDRDDGSTAGRIEFERRLTSRLLLEFEGRWFSNVDTANPLQLFDRDSFATLRLTTFF